MEWLKNLGAAIDYIEENLDQEVSCGEAARIAGCSPSYFQRIFFLYFRGFTGKIHTAPQNDPGGL